MNRRQFFEVSGKGVLGTALLAATAGSAFYLTGCAVTLDDVIAWTDMGSAAIETVMGLLGTIGLVCAACSVAAPIVIAAIHAIASAIRDWKNAPADQKSTFWGKIQTAINVAITEARNFFASVNIPGANAIANTVLGIASLVLSALTGFIAKFFPTALTAALAQKYMLGSTVIPVKATFMSSGDFKKQFNALVTGGGHPEFAIH
jgi:hypothetical protein